MKKKSIILILILSLFILTGCTNVFKIETPTLEEKVDEEIEYLDSEIISMLNSLNNITYTNYKVIPTEVKQSNTASNPNSRMNESSSQNNSEQKENLTSSGESNSNKENKPEVTSQKMESSTILNNNTTIDWTKIKSNVEIIHSAWITCQMDLKELGIPEKQLLDFSEYLNNATISCKNEDKLKTMQELVNMYMVLDEFVDEYCNDKFKKNIIDIKKNILEVYLCIETLNWKEAELKISEAEQEFEQIKNSKNVEEHKKVDVERTGILIKELKQCLQLKDKDISLLKYKDLIQELSIL